MHYDLQNEAQTNAPSPWGAIPVQRRTLLIASADERCISLSLLHALRHEFPWLDVERIGSVRAACIRFSQVVPLILIDVQLFAELEELGSHLSRHHPQAIVGLLLSGCRDAENSKEILASAFVRGVLPMNLSLDVWLAAVRIMLLGGEYYSSAFLKSLSAPHAAPRSNGRSGARTDLDSGRSPFRHLTTRELQILEMVSRGLQNKLIASALHLSEHTVKIHMHNIIGKLGVHNRTEAASSYLDPETGFKATIQVPPLTGDLRTP